MFRVAVFRVAVLPVAVWPLVTGFSAQPGYDLASGVGTVDASTFVPELAEAAQ